MNAPWLVPSLFPRLPRRSMAGFHGALAVGVALVLVLTARLAGDVIAEARGK